MGKGRLEAFSDGVIAILITIMVLELKTPESAALETLKPLVPVLSSYALSFVFLGIYWNNHHHLLQAAQRVNGAVLWANLHLLFWLSLIPFVTAWMGATDLTAPWPLALYGVVMMGAGVAYFILSRLLLSLHGNESLLGVAIRKDPKGIWSLVFYALAIPLSFYQPRIAIFLYLLVVLIWLIPDRRIESILSDPSTL